MNQYGSMTRAGANSECLCDLRSDTVTRPDDAMRRVMAEAPVGDDVYGEDPSIIALETHLSDMLGKDSATFFPSGTQCNLAAVMSHCGRSDEIIVGDSYHIYCDEAAGASVLASVSMCPVRTEPDGSILPEIIQSAIKEDDDHYAHSRLLCLENTVGGQAIAMPRIKDGVAAARSAGLSVHLDGARFFNAISALDCDPAELAEPFDTISICLSKGLAAPVGSVLVGHADLIARARRIRKLLGGGMRQSGILAAAGLHALTHNVDRLAEDHQRAADLANYLNGLGIGLAVAQTNMVFLTPATHPDLQQKLAAHGIRIGGQSPTIRMVLHKDVDDTALAATKAAFERVIT